MRSIEQIKREIEEAEGMASADLKSNPSAKLSGEAIKVLWGKRVDALHVELATAERARQAINSVRGIK